MSNSCIFGILGIRTKTNEFLALPEIWKPSRTHRQGGRREAGREAVGVFAAERRTQGGEIGSQGPSCSYPPTPKSEATFHPTTRRLAQAGWGVGTLNNVCWGSSVIAGGSQGVACLVITVGGGCDLSGCSTENVDLRVRHTLFRMPSVPLTSHVTSGKAPTRSEPWFSLL